MQGRIVDNLKFVKGLSPSADVYNGNPATDIVNLRDYGKVAFLIHQKANATSTAGTAVITIEACDNAAGSNATAIPFTDNKLTTGVSDTLGSKQTATAAGFTTTANEDTVYVIEADVRDLPDGQDWIRLVATEGVNAPVIGSCLILLADPKYVPMATAIA